MAGSGELAEGTGLTTRDFTGDATGTLADRLDGDLAGSLWSPASEPVEAIFGVLSTAALTSGGDATLAAERWLITGLAAATADCVFGELGRADLLDLTLLAAGLLARLALGVFCAGIRGVILASSSASTGTAFGERSLPPDFVLPGLAAAVALAQAAILAGSSGSAASLSSIPPRSGIGTGLRGLSIRLPLGEASLSIGGEEAMKGGGGVGSTDPGGGAAF